MLGLIEKIRKFQSQKISVIGDLILDKYLIGECCRISPEAPIPVLEIKEEKYNPGGAGNTAVNIKELNGIPYLIGIIGKDKEGDIFREELKKRGMLHSEILSSPYTKTILKERLVSLNQQLLRVDHNDEITENKEHHEFIFNRFSGNSDSEIVILSDYAKGTLSEDLIKNIISSCRKRNKIVIIDPRPSHTSAYKNASFITPNFKEACEMVGLDLSMNQDNAQKLAKSLNEKLNSKIILTMADQGILFYDSFHFKYFPTFKREIRDVSGAGDTVVAAFAIGLANNLNINEAIYLANHAAGVKVEKSGVQPVSIEEVIEDIKLHNS